MVKMFYDADCNLSLLDGKTVAIIGFGSQGHAHAMNLKDSGVHVVVGLRPGSKHEKKAKDYGLEVMTPAEAAAAGDIIMMLTPDEKQAAHLQGAVIEPNLKPGNVLAFAHGFNIHFKQIVPPADVDVIMIAPKGPGHTVRRTVRRGSGRTGSGLRISGRFRQGYGHRSGIRLRYRRRPCRHPRVHLQGPRPRPTCSVSRLSSAAAFAS